MPNDTLPLPVVRYLAARTPDEIAHCFTEDGVATDERRTHQGRDAIRRWREEVAKVDYSQEILSARHDGDNASVETRLTGSFPGSPVQLTLRFEMAEGLIRRLEIA